MDIGIVMTDALVLRVGIDVPRTAAQYGWQNPREWSPPHRVTHEEKLEKLYLDFVENGWDLSKPSLLGYICPDGHQLITGSHRHAAAILAGIKVPVDVVSYYYLREIWGTDEWLEMLERQNHRCGHVRM